MYMVERQKYCVLRIFIHVYMQKTQYMNRRKDHEAFLDWKSKVIQRLTVNIENRESFKVCLKLEQKLNSLTNLRPDVVLWSTRTR